MFRSKEDKKLVQNRLRKFEAVILLIALVIAGFGIYEFGPSLTGFVIKQFSYTEDLNLVVTSSGNYTWNPENFGELKSLKIGGKVSNSGTARVYIESNGVRYLVFDSYRLNESENKTVSNQTSLITGFSVKEEKGNGSDKGNDTKEEDNKESDKDKKKKNNKPEWDGPGSFTINETTTLNLSNYFSDEDEDSLTYSASSESDKLLVSDGVDSTSQIARVIAIVEESSVQNKAPVWNLAIDRFVINGSVTIDLSGYF